MDEDDAWYRGEEPPSVRTKLLVDRSKSIIIKRSADVPFDRSLNAYRGCKHGYIYCFAPATHDYLRFWVGLDFETGILYKPNAAALLRRGLSRPRYQRLEYRLGITRSILGVLVECPYPKSKVTRSSLVARDANLKKLSEPGSAAPSKRLRTTVALANSGRPVRVIFAPVIPTIDYRELKDILLVAADSGATKAGYILQRLPHELPMLFGKLLRFHFQQRRRHALNLIASTGGRSLYDSTLGTRMRGTGPYAEMLGNWFGLACRRFGLNGDICVRRSDRFGRPEPDGQMEIFGDG